MTKDEFDARLDALRWIDRDMIIDRVSGLGFDSITWGLFRERPAQFYATMATPRERDAIWRASEQAMAKRGLIPT